MSTPRGVCSCALCKHYEGAVPAATAPGGAHRRRTFSDMAADFLYGFLVVAALLVVVGAPIYLMAVGAP